MKVAYVFPAQGSQQVGMGRDLYDSFASAKAAFEQADEALGFPLSRLCFEGPEAELRQTINAQPALVTVSYACLRATCEVSGSGLPPPAFVAGHSLGEYTALAVAGVLDFATVVYLTRERGRLMYEAGLRQPGGMAAIIGLDQASLAEVCDQTGTWMANVNCPGQLVISGAKENLAQAVDLAKARGAQRAISLTLPFGDPLVPIVANTTAQPMTHAEQVKTELLRQFGKGVQWQRSIEYMINEGVSTFIEIGPGGVLSGLIRRINKDVKTISIGDASAIKNLIK